MRIRPFLAAATLLSLSGVVSAQGVSASTAASHRVSASFAPVVIESFSVLHPKVGQHVAVLVRFVNNNRPVAGARLTATIRVGKHTLMTVHGAPTNKSGKASAPFTVPGAARGKTVRVLVSMKYKGHAYAGRNDLKVRG
jgi:hypothetical protein